MLTILYTIFIAPLEFAMRCVLDAAHGAVGSYGWAVVVMSLVVNTVILPIYNKAEGWQEEERRIKKGFEAREAMIKRVFKGQERFAMLSTMRRQAGYSPMLAFRSSIGFLLQIPFFFAAYHLLSHFEPIRGVAFGWISDLGQPDAMIQAAGLSINVLPLVMTAVNLLSAFVYTAALTRQDKIQLYGLSALFLLLLYDSPAALTFYWTLNNVYSLGKNVVEKSWLPHWRARYGRSFPESLARWSETFLDRVPLPPAAGAGLFLLSFAGAAWLAAWVWRKNAGGVRVDAPQLEAFLLLTLVSAAALVAAVLKWRGRCGALRRASRLRWFASLSLTLSFIFVLAALAAGLDRWYSDLKHPPFLVAAGAAFILLSWLAALLLAAVEAWMGRRIENSNLEHDGQTIWAASALIWALLFALGLPMLVYASDPGSVTGGLVVIFPILALVFGVTLTALFALGGLFPKALKPALGAVMLGLLLAGVAYAFIFVGNYGVIMDGELDNPAALSNGANRWMDAAVGLGIAALVWALYRFVGRARLAKALPTCAAFVLIGVLTSASWLMLQDERRPDVGERPPAQKAERPAYADALYAFSGKGRNVVHVVFDMFTADHFPQLMAEMPEVARAFEGFVWFKDTLSVGSGTSFGLAGATGGNRYSVKAINENNEGRTVASLYAQSYTRAPNFLGDAWNSAVGGWIWAPKAEDWRVKPVAVEPSGALTQDWYEYYYAERLAAQTAAQSESAASLVLSISAFKMAPYSARKAIYRKGAWLMPTRGSIGAFRAFAPLRALEEQSRIAEDQPDTYRYFYFEGTHTGYFFDEAGSPAFEKRRAPTEWQQSHPDVDYSHYLSEKAHLQAFARWLEWLKAQGIYDRTRIIVTSDHGGNDTHALLEVLGHVPSRGQDANGAGYSNPGLRYPLLIAKDFDAKGDWRTDEHRLMTNGDGLDLSLDGLAEIPELYRGDWRNPNRVRWYVSSDDWNFDKPALDAFIYEVRGSMFEKSNWKGLHP